MSEMGVFAVDRGIFEHEFFPAEPFTQREAWQWLIACAEWKPRKCRVGHVQVSLKRGQFANSQRFMDKRSQWKIAKVQRFLKRIKIDTMIDTRSDTGVTIITIYNYDKFQRVSLPSDTSDDTQNDTAAIQQRYKEEN